MTRARPADRGFTLLEVLVALAIAMLALAALYRAGIVGVGAAREAARYDDAVSRAQSHLDTALHGGTLAPGDWQGDDGDGYRWRLQVRQMARSLPMQASLAAGPTPQAVSLYAVTVWIAWRSSGGRAREVRLETRQVAASAAS